MPTILKREASRLLGVSTRSISRKIPASRERVSVSALKKAFQIDETFLARAIAGHDHAITAQQASHHLRCGKSVAQGALKPILRLERGVRFSALQIGLHEPTPTGAA